MLEEGEIPEINLNKTYKSIILQLSGLNADLNIYINNLKKKYDKEFQLSDELLNQKYDTIMNEIEDIRDNIDDELDKYNKLLPQINGLMDETKEIMYNIYDLTFTAQRYIEPTKISTLQSLAFASIPKMTNKEKKDLPQEYKTALKYANLQRMLNLRSHKSHKREIRKTKKQKSK